MGVSWRPSRSPIHSSGLLWLFPGCSRLARRFDHRAWLGPSRASISHVSGAQPMTCNPPLPRNTICLQYL